MPGRWWDWPDRCRIVRVIDGDTAECAFTAETDLGFRVVLRGETAAVCHFAEGLMAERGVRHGALNVIALEAEHSHSHGRNGAPHKHYRPLR